MIFMLAWKIMTFSRRALEKAGFNYEGTMKNNTMKNRKVLDMAMYARTKEPYTLRRLTTDERDTDRWNWDSPRTKALIDDADSYSRNGSAYRKEWKWGLKIDTMILIICLARDWHIGYNIGKEAKIHKLLGMAGGETMGLLPSPTRRTDKMKKLRVLLVD